MTALRGRVRERTLGGARPMKFCYCDESGVGGEPIATMAAVITDQHRMRKTKEEWDEVLERISKKASRPVHELKTADLYKGKHEWGKTSGDDKSAVIEDVLAFIAERHHPIAVTAVDKSVYRSLLKEPGAIPHGLDTEWRLIGFHLVLGLQNAHKGLSRTTGDTVCIFDNREHDKVRFADIIAAPPVWSDEYYKRKKQAEPLHKIVDAPYFGDSKELPLIQIADFISFMYRRFAEVTSGVGPKPFKDEEVKLTAWIEQLQKYTVRPLLYPRQGRTAAHEVFWQCAPECIRDLR